MIKGKAVQIEIWSDLKWTDTPHIGACSHHNACLDWKWCFPLMGSLLSGRSGLYHLLHNPVWSFLMLIKTTRALMLIIPCKCSLNVVRCTLIREPSGDKKSGIKKEIKARTNTCSPEWLLDGGYCFYTRVQRPAFSPQRTWSVSVFVWWEGLIERPDMMRLIHLDKCLMCDAQTAPVWQHWLSRRVCEHCNEQVSFVVMRQPVMNTTYVMPFQFQPKP